MFYGIHVKYINTYMYMYNVYVRIYMLLEPFNYFQGLLISCNQMSADYLFQRDKHYDVTYDTGDKVIQCGRHNDIFKFWLQWRSRVRRNAPYQP